MNTKEKAKELVEKFIRIEMDSPSINLYIDFEAAKQCALIAVDEIITGLENQRTFTGHKFHQVRFYEQVKQELELL